MTETGARWKAYVTLPDFGERQTYWAVPYAGGTRYVEEPKVMQEELHRWLKPMYAIRITARQI